MALKLNIDCAPGRPRPDAVLADMAKALNLEVGNFRKEANCFGDWTFSISPDYEPTMRARADDILAWLQIAYEAGRIRFASLA